MPTVPTPDEQVNRRVSTRSPHRASRARLCHHPFFALGLTVLLTGCVHFEEKPLDVTESARAFESRTFTAPDLRLFIETNLGPVSPWPPAEWDFEPLALAAFFYHPALDVARAEYGAIRAAEITAGARPNPTLGVTPEYTVNPASGVSPWIATIQWDIPIETAGKRGHRIARAKQLSEGARLRLANAAWKVRSDLRAALLDFQDAAQRTNILSRQLQAQQRVASGLESKLALGAATTTEVAPARLALARTRKDLADAQVELHEARARVAAAIGVPLASLPAIAALKEGIQTNSPLTSAEVRRRALTSRSDLLASLADYAAAETELKLEIARQYPDVHLGTGYQYDQGENKWSLGLTAEIPVLNRNQGPIAEASARRAEAAASVLALQARIIGDVDRALAVWEGAQARLGTLNEMRAAQAARTASLRARLEAGAIEALDLLTAEAELQTNELLYWDAHVKISRALGNLEDAIQRPFLIDISRNPRSSPP